MKVGSDLQLYDADILDLNPSIIAEKHFPGDDCCTKGCTKIKRPSVGVESLLIISIILASKWCPGTESNRRHEDFQFFAPMEMYIKISELQDILLTGIVNCLMPA